MTCASCLTKINPLAKELLGGATLPDANFSAGLLGLENDYYALENYCATQDSDEDSDRYVDFNMIYNFFAKNQFLSINDKISQMLTEIEANNFNFREIFEIADLASLFVQRSPENWERLANLCRQNKDTAPKKECFMLRILAKAFAGDQKFLSFIQKESASRAKAFYADDFNEFLCVVVNEDLSLLDEFETRQFLEKSGFTSAQKERLWINWALKDNENRQKPFWATEDQDALWREDFSDDFWSLTKTLQEAIDKQQLLPQQENQSFLTLDEISLFWKRNIQTAVNIFSDTQLFIFICQTDIYNSDRQGVQELHKILSRPENSERLKGVQELLINSSSDYSYQTAKLFLLDIPNQGFCLQQISAVLKTLSSEDKNAQWRLETIKILLNKDQNSSAQTRNAFEVLIKEIENGRKRFVTIAAEKKGSFWGYYVDYGSQIPEILPIVKSVWQKDRQQNQITAVDLGSIFAMYLRNKDPELLDWVKTRNYNPTGITEKTFYKYLQKDSDIAHCVLETALQEASRPSPERFLSSLLFLANEKRKDSTAEFLVQEELFCNQKDRQDFFELFSRTIKDKSYVSRNSISLLAIVASKKEDLQKVIKLKDDYEYFAGELISCAANIRSRLLRRKVFSNKKLVSKPR